MQKSGARRKIDLKFKYGKLSSIKNITLRWFSILIDFNAI